jgi:hypothetical protein
MLPMRRSLRLLTLSALCAGLLLPAAARAADHDLVAIYAGLDARIDAMEAHPLVEVGIICTSAGGRPVRVLRLGTAQEHPAVLIVGAVDARQQYAAGLALRVAQRLADALEADPDLQGRCTFYVVPQPNPDGAARLVTAPLLETAANLTPTDDDRDGEIDEDGPEDLNGDNRITLLRVQDPTGGWLPHPLDGRVMIPAQPDKDEAGQYAVYVEGTDNDTDEQWNEDGIGGVDLNRNFPFQYPFFQPGSGQFQCCEPESRGLADWLWERQNVALILTLGGDDNLLNPWTVNPADNCSAVKSGLAAGDEGYFKRVTERFKELVPDAAKPEATDGAGSLLKWSYFHYGRWAFGTRWWLSEEKKEEGKTANDSAGTESAAAAAGQPASTTTQAKWDEKDTRGQAQLRALQRYDALGVDGFVDWTPVQHPDFPGKLVEVGGLEPFLLMNPTAAELDALAPQRAEFALALAGMLPRIELLETQVESLDAGIYRVTTRLVNSGYLPTLSAMGELTGVPYPLQLELKLPPGAALVTGRPRELLPRIAGGGGSLERSWIVRGSGALTITAASPSIGAAAATVNLEVR